MLKRRRFSRIYYTRKFFDYPVSLKLSTILNLGVIKTLVAGFSYLKSTVIKRKEKNLEDFMINRFGKVLYETFFENYTEKVSTMIRGNKRIELIPYKDIKEITDNLEKILKI